MIRKSQTINLVQRQTVIRKMLTQSNHHEVQLNWFTLKMLQLHLRELKEVKDYIVHQFNVRGYNGLEIIQQWKKGKLYGSYFIVYSDDFSDIEGLKEVRELSSQLFSLEEFTVVETLKKIICFKQSSQKATGWGSLEVFRDIVKEGYFILKVQLEMKFHPKVSSVSDYLSEENRNERASEREEEVKTQSSRNNTPRRSQLERHLTDNPVRLKKFEELVQLDEVQSQQEEERKSQSVELQRYLNSPINKIRSKMDETFQQNNTPFMEGPKGLKPNRDVPAFNAIMQVLLTGFPEYPWDQIFALLTNLSYQSQKSISEERTQGQLEKDLKALFVSICQFLKDQSDQYFVDFFSMALKQDYHLQVEEVNVPILTLCPDSGSSRVKILNLLKRDFLVNNQQFIKLRNILGLAVQRDKLKYSVKFEEEIIIPHQFFEDQEAKQRFQLVGAVLSDPTESLAVVKWNNNWLLCHDEKIEILDKEEYIKCLENEAILYIYRRS